MRCVWLAIAVCCLAASPVLGDDKKPFVGPPAPPAELKVLRTIVTDEKAGFAEGGGLVVAFSPDGRILATADEYQFRFWDPSTGKEVVSENPAAWKTKEFTDEIAFVDRNTVATYAVVGTHVRLQAFPSGKEVARLALAKEPILRSMAVAPGLVAVCDAGYPSGIRLYAGPKWKQSWRVKIPQTRERDNDCARQMTFSPDRSQLLVTTHLDQVVIYRVKDGEILRHVAAKTLGTATPKVAYHPSGHELAIASGSQPARAFDWSVSLWDTQLEKRRTEARWGRQADPAHPILRDAWGCLYTPDGKTILIPCVDGTVRMYEAETGRLRRVGGLPGKLPGFVCTLSPDGRLLVVGAQHKAFVIDWRAPTATAHPPDAMKLSSLWTALTSLDSEKGFQAVLELESAPVQTAKFLREKLKPVPIPNAEAVKAWIAALGSEQVAARDAAEKELAKLGDAIEPELRQAAKSAVFARSIRANQLLEAISSRDNPERLRILRAVEVLEYTDTPAGRKVLKTLAGGAPSAILTRDAKAALARLKAFDPKP